MATKTFLIINRHSQMALQTTGSTSGLVVNQSEITYDKSQLWSIIGKNDSAKIINEENGQVLDLMYGGTENGTAIQTWENVEDGDSQYWSIAVSSRGFRKITNKLTGKVLDIKDLSSEKNVNAQIWEDLGGEGQEWKLKEYPEVKKPAKKTKIENTKEKMAKKKISK